MANDTTQNNSFESDVAETRALLLEVEKKILALKSAPFFTEEEKEGVDKGEAVANIMLAYRAAEDARMRLGKIFQALNGGVSNNTR